MTGLQILRREYHRARKRGDSHFLLDMGILEDPASFDMKDLYDESCIYGDMCRLHGEDHTAADCETPDEYRANLDYEMWVRPFIQPAKNRLRSWYDEGKLTDMWTGDDVVEFARWIGYAVMEQNR